MYFDHEKLDVYRTAIEFNTLINSVIFDICQNVQIKPSLYRPCFLRERERYRLRYRLFHS